MSQMKQNVKVYASVEEYTDDVSRSSSGRSSSVKLDNLRTVFIAFASFLAVISLFVFISKRPFKFVVLLWKIIRIPKKLKFGLHYCWNRFKHH